MLRSPVRTEGWLNLDGAIYTCSMFKIVGLLQVLSVSNFWEQHRPSGIYVIWAIKFHKIGALNLRRAIKLKIIVLDFKLQMLTSY